MASSNRISENDESEETLTNQISEEFSRIQKLHDDAVLKFKRSVPFILEYALKAKPKIYEEVSNKFSNANVRALVLLTKLLTVTLSKNTTSPEEREHIKNFKTSIESIPSSALFQVVPEGTDVENHVSEETHPVLSEQLAPIFPYLLWSTRDFRSGMIYLKIDKLCFLIERVENEDSILRAFDIFIKAHHVFMLKYHPYLRTTLFDYFESLYGIKTPLNSVARFVTALRNMN
ncbi:Ribonucleoside-diphosphate reductase nrdEB subunit alpha [Frankliniella fusca]|uniref:Ribonucleoside-diphosphate reductase nrdEB subunit alpha n=1 Tax=Frankliniella fusca TaxID=407009 RepID=A0AAE1HI00_9NEOP|nr:Ribonucleoside-diphosphate reductase nrdEB subunit alpha [Frankliniella fusca]